MRTYPAFLTTGNINCIVPVCIEVFSPPFPPGTNDEFYKILWILITRNLSSFFFLICTRTYSSSRIFISQSFEFQFSVERQTWSRIIIDESKLLEGSLENLIRHRLRSFPLLPGKNSHRRRENKFHAPRNRKQGGADRGNTFFHPQFLSRRPGEGRGRQIQIARQTWSNTER